MKKLYSLILFTLLSYACFSQAKNYFVDGSRWVYQTNESYEPGFNMILFDNEQQILIQGDTVINAIAYKKLFSSTIRTTTINTDSHPQSYVHGDSVGGRYVRYDSITERVFFLDSTTASEVLIYDFNLNVGDSLPAAYRNNYAIYNSGELNGGTGDGRGVIDSIVTIDLFGSPARKFYLKQSGCCDIPDGNYIIEGVGGANGFWYDNPDLVVINGGDFSTELSCFQSGDSILLGYLNNTGCPYLDFTAGVKNIVGIADGIILFPNPATSQLNIFASSFYPEEVLTVSIMNMLGQQTSPPAPLLQERGVASIDVSELPAGIYFLQMKGESGSVVKKFVKE